MFIYDRYTTVGNSKPSRMSMVSRTTKWHPTPPPPPSSKILHLPRRSRTRRRNQTKSHNNPLLLINQANNESHGLPPELLHSSVERRERVEERGFTEKWRFQAEMLRAECNLLRMERELALKKLEKNRVKMEATLRSAVQTLQSGRKKIEEGKNDNPVLEEEMEDLAEKIEELQNSSRLKESQVGTYGNRLEKLGALSNEDKSQKEVDSCSPISMKKLDITKEPTDEAMPKEGSCSGHCKAIVGRIVEQVRAETEQWSQMQKMLEKVKAEMEHLQASRDFWERQAHTSDSEARSLRHAVEAWKDRALDYEKQVKDLELKLSSVQQQKKTGDDKHHAGVDLPSPHSQLLKLKKNEENEKTAAASLSLAKQLAKEKRLLIRSRQDREGLAEDGDSNRIALRDIVNSPLPERQNHRIAFHYHSPESSRIRENFRK